MTIIDICKRRTWKAALIGTAVLAISPGPAAAQNGGVFVDPDSPSGKEYAIPLESARRQADPQPPTGQAGGPAAAPATLFGEGVVASRERRGNEGAGKSRDKPSSSGGGAENPTARTAPEIVGIAASRPGAPDGGVGTPILVLGFGLLVVLVGALAGVLIRRRASS